MHRKELKIPTRRYSINPQDEFYQIIEAVGAATATKAIELTVDFTALDAMPGVEKAAVIKSLQRIEEYIIRGNWPPA